MEQKGKNFLETLQQLKQPATGLIGEIWFQTIRNLTGTNPDPARLQVEPGAILPGVTDDIKFMAQFNSAPSQLLLNCLFENDELADWPEVLQQSQQSPILTNTIEYPNYVFYFTLLQLRVIKQAGPSEEHDHLRDEAQKGFQQIRTWADLGPQNFLHRLYFLQAEFAALDGNVYEAGALYDRAIETAYHNRFLCDAGLANECAAKLYRDNGRDQLAEFYFQKAWACYREWGAAAKVQHLEERYPKYLRHPAAARTSGSTSSTTLSAALDVHSILKATQILSGEVQLPRLLENMLHILLENAGAQRGVFLKCSGTQCVVQARGTSEHVSDILAAQPMEEADDVPLAALRYVIASRKPLVFDNLAKDQTYVRDNYVQQHQPLSVVCAPLLKQGELVGLIYLENNAVEGAFTPARLEVLNMLAAQIAISIENAELYENLEEKVAQRTADLQQANAELEKSREAAEAANHAKSQFLANMSHELRTPLNSILGYSQILKRNRHADTIMKDGLDIIQQSGNHLLMLINDILDLAKIEARKMELYPEPLNVHNFLDGVVGIIRMRAQQKDVRFLYEPAPNLPAGIEADEKRLRQVLLNLLGNAVKFTDAGGTVAFKILDLRFKITDGPDDKSQISNLKFQIDDSGVGMTAEQVETIFEPFEQVGAVERRTEGTGLGLTISRQLVELMGGKVQVTSELGQGSTFWFEAAFPVVEVDSAKAVSAQREITGYTGERRHILVVDDRADIRMMLLNLLEPLGFRVTLAENGQQALDKAHETPPDFIFIDLVMPVMNGFEAVNILRRTPAFKHVPIVAISASVYSLDEVESRKVGCDGFLAKPIDTQKLFGLLAAHLSIEWLSEEAALESDQAVPLSDAELVPPPRENLEMVYEFAMLGRMSRIREQANHIEALNHAYAPFAQRLRELVKNFDDVRIVKLVQYYLEKHHES